MSFVTNPNLSRTPLYFQSPPATQYVPSQVYQRPTSSNSYYNSFQPLPNHDSMNINNYRYNLVSTMYSPIQPSFQSSQSYRSPVLADRKIYSSNQKVNTFTDRKYLNSNLKSTKYNTSERISQQPEFLQASTKRISQNYQQKNYQNNQKLDSRLSQSSKFKYQQKKDQSFYNINMKPDPVYCVLCERYYEFQQQKQHLQKHRKVKSPQKMLNRKQLNQKVIKFQKKIPISVPSEFVVTQNVCKMDFNRNKKDVQVNTSQGDFVHNQNIKIQNTKESAGQKQIFIIQEEKKSFSNKSNPKKIVENINLKQNQSNTLKVSQLKNSNDANKEQGFIQICPSQYNVSDRNLMPQYVRKNLNVSQKQKVQNKFTVSQKEQQNVQNQIKNIDGYGLKPNIRMPSAKIQKPDQNQSVYQQQSRIQIQPTQFNFQQLSVRNNIKVHKSQKNYGNKQYQISINMNERKSSSQIKKQSPDQSLQSSSLKLKNGSFKNQNNPSKKLPSNQKHQELYLKNGFKKNKNSQNQIIYSSNESKQKQVDNFQIQSNKTKNKSQSKSQIDKNIKIQSNSKIEASSVKKSSKSSRKQVQLIDIGVGDGPVDIQSPGPSQEKSNSSKKQKKGKNMLIYQPY